MEVFLHHPRAKRKQARSQSLPARVNSVHASVSCEKTEEVDAEPGLKSQPQVGKTTFVHRTVDETYPQPRLDDWSHLKPDERGAELAREARVWKVYVGETDKWDKELVEGWDKSMDVLLVFAALFSAVLAAFLIESSGMLKQDPNDVSAAALLVISQTLVTITAKNTSADSPALSLPELSNVSDFVPSRGIVVVNTLWYTALSLSIASAFLAMLAKDWCHSFSAHRTGHPRDQAHRRQRKWKLIERWQMQEFLLLLPSLMQLSLLLFSVGLCIYLWDLNRTTALPVMCVAGASLLFYIGSSIIASIVEFFPYTTILSRMFRSKHKWILNSAIAICGSFIALLTRLLYLAFVTFEVVTSVCLSMVIWPVCGVFVILDRLTLRRFAKPGVRIAYLWFSCSNAVLTPFHMVWPSFARLGRDIRSRVHRTIKSLELTDDLTTSLALGWLIQYCETPSAVDIALQAIAGASQGIPKDPLLSSGATVQIMRHIVSRSSSDRERLGTDLYTQSLEFLGSNSSLTPDDGERRITGDIAVMVWDLKSKNEREIANLIKDERFVPSTDNLEAMQIGNSAATQSLYILMGKARTAIESLDKITSLLSRQLEPENTRTRLHPAAIQSLANAAALYTSLSTVSQLPPRLAYLAMKYCQWLISKHSEHQSTGSTSNFAAGAILIICVLLHDNSSMDKHSGTMQSIVQHRTRVRNTIRILIDTYVGGQRYQGEVFWVGCTEILSNPLRYGLNEETNDWESLRLWCSERAHRLMCLFPNPYHLRWSHNNSAKDAHSLFLKASSEVYNVLAVPKLQGSMPVHLPEPIYGILAKISCTRWSNPWQRQACIKLLSKSGFPRPSQAFLEIWEQPIFWPRQPLIRYALDAYSNFLGHAGRNNAAIQLWLLLHLSSDSPDIVEDLRRMIRFIAYSRLRNTSFDGIKSDLETYIIEMYRIELRSAAKLAGDRNDDSIAPITDNTLSSRLVDSDAQQYFEQFNPTQGTKAIDICAQEDRVVYLARVVECILQTRGTQGNEDLVDLIEANLKDLPPWLRGLPPSLPPSRPVSGASVRTDVAPGPHPTTDPPITNTGHSVVEVHDLPGTSNLGNY